MDLLYGADHLSFPQRKKIKKCDQERISLQWEIRTFSSPFQSSIFGPMWENICFEITVGESPSSLLFPNTLLAAEVSACNGA